MRMWFSKKRHRELRPSHRASTSSFLSLRGRPTSSIRPPRTWRPTWSASPTVNLADVAHTLRAGRRAMKYRRAVVTASICDAPSVLRQWRGEAVVPAADKPDRSCSCSRAAALSTSTWPRILQRRARLPRRDGRVPEEPRTESALRMEIAALSSTGRGGRCRGGSGATFVGPSSAVCHAARPGTHVDGVGHQAVRIHRAQYGRARRHTSPAC